MLPVIAAFIIGAILGVVVHRRYTEPRHVKCFCGKENCQLGELTYSQLHYTQMYTPAKLRESWDRQNGFRYHISRLDIGPERERLQKLAMNELDVFLSLKREDAHIAAHMVEIKKHE